MESFNKGLEFGTDVAMWILNMTAAVVGFFLPIIVVVIVGVMIALLGAVIFGEK